MLAMKSLQFHFSLFLQIPLQLPGVQAFGTATVKQARSISRAIVSAAPVCPLKAGSIFSDAKSVVKTCALSAEGCLKDGVTPIRHQGADASRPQSGASMFFILPFVCQNCWCRKVERRQTASRRQAGGRRTDDG